jgi:2-amino-4-hydroxy-6-hydroxymethyldihydropteridine diphosphokinase/dihydropteroate synthase
MSILNLTPDSFSDGGLHSSDEASLEATISAHIAAGATIIDVGGQSSRPGAADITAVEETSRILPAIRAFHNLPKSKTTGVALSIDTYRAPVAAAAIAAGAHIINDISGGLLDPDMLPTVSRLGCTYVLTHLRGTPGTMQNAENTSYPGGLIPTLIDDLAARCAAAQEAGIRRWRIILDPGVGFAKTTAQNLEILRRMPELRNAPLLRGYPWLVGTSRKGFLGQVLGLEKGHGAKERVWGTASTMAAAVWGGADVVRVHDVKEMAQVVRTADRVWRIGES